MPLLEIRCLTFESDERRVLDNLSLAIESAEVHALIHREEIALVADKASQICRGGIVCSGSPSEVADYYRARTCLICDGQVCG